MDIRVLFKGADAFRLFSCLMMMGQPVGKDIPTMPGIYIHQGKKICVSRMP